MKCKCCPKSPFRWRETERPSIFALDIHFRPKNVKPSTDYLQFGIYARAHPSVKPQLNKHEV